MYLMSGSANEPIVVWLEDGREIEITIVELEGSKVKILVCADEQIELIRKHLNKKLE